jgi:hypothetical protein
MLNINTRKWGRSCKAADFINCYFRSFPLGETEVPGSNMSWKRWFIRVVRVIIWLVRLLHILCTLLPDSQAILSSHVRFWNHHNASDALVICRFPVSEREIRFIFAARAKNMDTLPWCMTASLHISQCSKITKSCTKKEEDKMTRSMTHSYSIPSPSAMYKLSPTSMSTFDTEISLYKSRVVDLTTWITLLVCPKSRLLKLNVHTTSFSLWYFFDMPITQRWQGGYRRKIAKRSAWDYNSALSPV